MNKIGLDLAVKTVGVAILDEKRLVFESYTISSKKLSVFESQKLMVDWVWEYIKPFLTEENSVVVEDVFSGINPKASINAARVQGALIDRYIQTTGKYPHLVMAASARKNIGIDCRWSKAQIQMYIIDKFGLGEIDKKTRSSIISLPIQHERKKETFKTQMKGAGKGRQKILKKQWYQTKKEFDNEMKRLSTEVKQQTKIDEHIADAIVLALQK